MKVVLFDWLRDWFEVAAVAVGRAGVLASLVTMMVGGSAWGQGWVEAAESRIEDHRKTDVRVIVLEELKDGVQRPAVGARVRIEQLRHDFPLGVVLEAPSVAGFDPEGLFFRSLNAVSLKRLTAWPVVQPSGPNDFELERIETAVTWAEVFGLDVHWGGMLAADPAYQPEWAAAMDADERLRVAARYVDVVGWTFAGRLRSASLYTHHMAQPWLSEAGLRWLFNHGKTADAGFELRLGYEQALDGERLRSMMIDADDKSMGFVRNDGVTVSHAFGEGMAAADGGRFVAGRLHRNLTRLGAMGQSVLVDGLEVGGGLVASAHLEAALITLFSSPAVEGIYLDGLTASTAADASAVLVDEGGQPTSCGLVVDRLFRERWWTDLTATTDELGNVRARGFAGLYRVTAELADGRVLTTEVLLPKSEAERVVVLEPVWASERAAGDR